MQQALKPQYVQAIGVALIVFAVFFNLPYTWLGMHFDYPGILRQPAGLILEAFAKGGTPLILAWAAFTLAALLFAPIAIAVARVTRPVTGVAALGIAAGVTQAIGLSRWVYAVPGLAGAWMVADDQTIRVTLETAFITLHQFAGVGIGEAIGQSLTAFWLIAESWNQMNHPRFGKPVAYAGFAGAAFLILGLAEGFATVITFDPGLLGLGAMLGFLVLTVWLIWTGVLCILRPDTNG